MDLFAQRLFNFGYEKIKHDKIFPWLKSKNNVPLQFDFFIEPLCILLELDGDHHFFQVSNWRSPLITHEIDVFKMREALKHGFSIIRLYQPEVLKKSFLFSELEPHLIRYQSPVVKYISNTNVYDSFPKL